MNGDDDTMFKWGPGVRATVQVCICLSLSQICSMCQALSFSPVLPICHAVSSSQTASVVQEAAVLKLH